jgi:hypothetical protein
LAGENRPVFVSCPTCDVVGQRDEARFKREIAPKLDAFLAQGDRGRDGLIARSVLAHAVECETATSAALGETRRSYWGSNELLMLRSEPRQSSWQVLSLVGPRNGWRVGLTCLAPWNRLGGWLRSAYTLSTECPKEKLCICDLR